MELELKTQLEKIATDTKEAVDSKVKTALDPIEKKAADLEAQLTEKSAKMDTLEAAMRTQGDVITALKNASTPSEPKDLNLEAIIQKAMPDIEKLYNKRENGTEFVLDVKAAAIMTTDNTTNFDTFTIPNTLIESMSMAEFAGKRYGRQFIADVADVNTVSEMTQYTTWLQEGNEQGAFAIVAEGGLKPLVSYDLVRNFAEAQKIAGKYVVTEEFAKWRQNAYTIIRRLIQDKLIREYSALITTGINAAAAGYTGTTLDDQIVAPNDYDAIGAVSAQIESLNFIPNVLILHPQDKWRMRLAKDSDNRYLFPVVTEDGTTRIFELQLITSTYQTPGFFTIGESGLYKVEQEAIQMRMGYGIDVTTVGGNVTAVTSDFDHNRFRVILEMFFKQWLPTPYIGSFVRAQFSTVKAALLKP